MPVPGEALGGDSEAPFITVSNTQTLAGGDAAGDTLTGDSAGNVLTGKGNIVESRKSAKKVMGQLADERLGLAPISDGDAVTAADVKYSFDSQSGKYASPTYSAVLVGVSKATVVDARTIRFDLSDRSSDTLFKIGGLSVFSHKWGLKADGTRSAEGWGFNSRFFAPNHSEILQALLDTAREVNRSPVALGDISPKIQKAVLAVEDADRPDFPLGDMPAAADHRQQPARFGVLFGADRSAKPHAAVAHAVELVPSQIT